MRPLWLAVIVSVGIATFGSMALGQHEYPAGPYRVLKTAKVGGEGGFEFKQTRLDAACTLSVAALALVSRFLTWTHSSRLAKFQFRAPPRMAWPLTPGSITASSRASRSRCSIPKP